MNWDELEAFTAVAEELNFSRAARRLHISSPAVSQRILRLERHLGTRLFERTTRRVVLTPAGAVLLDEVGDLRAALLRIRDRVRETDAEEGSDAPLALSGVPAGPVLDRLRDALPGRTWRAVRLASAGEVAAAVRAEARAAVVYVYPYAPWSGFRGLAVATVIREPLWVYLPAGHRLADRDEVGMDELAAERWIVPPEPAARRALGRLAGEHDVRPRIQHVAAGLRETLALVVDGRGIALGSPTWPLPDRATRVRLAGPQRAGVRLVWDPARTDPEWAASLLPPLRDLYAEVAARENAPWWEDFRAGLAELEPEG